MLRISLICASLAAIASAAYAQEAAESDTAPKIIDAKQVGTRDEAKLYAQSEFLQADQDRDGKVDKAEFIAYATARAPLPNHTIKDVTADEEEKTANKKAKEKTETASAGEAEAAEDQFAEISKGDDAISKDELVEKRLAQFDAADENGDEELDAVERAQYAQLTTPKAPRNTL